MADGLFEKRVWRMGTIKPDDMHTELPYRGEQPYIFISYSHRNKDKVMEIIEHLHSAGYRVWYDEGIDPGSEWDDNIAYHVENCGFFIALLSSEYLNSSNCKDELNYARDLEKPRLLIYLEDIQLPGGMRMRLGRLQTIHKYRYDEQTMFYEKLFATRGLDSCLAADASEDANTVYYLVSLDDKNVKFVLKPGLNLVGKDPRKDAVVLNNQTVSRTHASITVSPQNNTLQDINASNGTFLNDQRLAANEERSIKDGDIVMFGTEQLVFRAEVATE